MGFGNDEWGMFFYSPAGKEEQKAKSLITPRWDNRFAVVDEAGNWHCRTHVSVGQLRSIRADELKRKYSGTISTWDDRPGDGTLRARMKAHVAANPQWYLLHNDLEWVKRNPAKEKHVPGINKEEFWASKFVAWYVPPPTYFHMLHHVITEPREYLEYLRYYRSIGLADNLLGDDTYNNYWIPHYVGAVSDFANIAAVYYTKEAFGTQKVATQFDIKTIDAFMDQALNRILRTVEAVVGTPNNLYAGMPPENITAKTLRYTHTSYRGADFPSNEVKIVPVTFEDGSKGFLSVRDALLFLANNAKTALQIQLANLGIQAHRVRRETTILTPEERKRQADPTQNLFLAINYGDTLKYGVPIYEDISENFISGYHRRFVKTEWKDMVVDVEALPATLAKYYRTPLTEGGTGRPGEDDPKKSLIPWVAGGLLAAYAASEML